MIDRLKRLCQLCGSHHLPYDGAGEEGEALDALIAQGMEVEEICPNDRNLVHVRFPSGTWTMADDENAHSGNPNDIGSVVVMRGDDAVASIVAGDVNAPHRYSLALP